MVCRMKRCAGLEAGIEIQRGNDRLQRIDQQGALAAAAAALLASAEAQILADLQLARRTKQVARADDVGAQLREFSFLVFGEAAKKFLADNKGEHGVAQKLHLLVIGRRRQPPEAFCDSNSRA